MHNVFDPLGHCHACPHPLGALERALTGLPWPIRYYIRKLIADKLSRQQDNTTRSDVEDSVFLCQPVEEGGCRVYACNACKKLCRRRDEKEYRQCTAAELDLFDGHDEDGTYASIGIGDKQPPEFAALTVNDRLALGVLQMADAVFKGYGGAGYTHSGGGGLLQPNDFHGMAALLVEAKSDSPDSGMHRRRREALRRLLDPIHGNSLVRSTLTCLEREIDGAMPTICEDSDDGGSEDERDGDGSQIRAQLLHGQTFTGAATSMLPPGETPAAVDNADPTVGVTHKRRGGGAARRQRAEGTSGRSNPDVATFTTLLHQRDGGFAPTENGASRRHYLHKTLGSVATPCRRAEEFIWYHFQMGVKRSLRASGPRMVNPHVALNASGDDVDAHTAQLREHWATLMLQVSRRPASPQHDAASHTQNAYLLAQEPGFVPYCNVRESFTGGVPQTVVGSKAYWCISLATAK